MPEETAQESKIQEARSWISSKLPWWAAGLILLVSNTATWFAYPALTDQTKEAAALIETNCNLIISDKDLCSKIVAIPEEPSVPATTTTK